MFIYRLSEISKSILLEALSAYSYSTVVKQKFYSKFNY